MPLFNMWVADYQILVKLAGFLEVGCMVDVSAKQTTLEIDPYE